MIEIVPSILTNSSQIVEEKITLLSPLFKRVQIDIIDGVFAKNKTIDPSVLETIETSLKLDFHLMTKEPLDWVERCARGLADRIIGQVEMMANQIEFIAKVQSVGVLCGLALDLETPVSAIEPTIINNLDIILIMDVKAGFGGQSFDKRGLAKAKELEKIRSGDQTPFKICLDGGLDLEHLKIVGQSGVDEVIIGERLFQGDLSENLKEYQKAVQV